MSAHKTATQVDIQGINGDVEAVAIDIEHGRELMVITKAFATRDAADVAGNFQRMVRIADATGIPVDSMDDPLSVEIRQALELDRFPSAANALPLGGDNVVECARENG